MNYLTLDKAEKAKLLEAEQLRMAEYAAKGLKLDMSRGKPSKEQLDISSSLYMELDPKYGFAGKQDYRNYGLNDGIPEIKKLFAELVGVEEDEIIVAYNASLNLMYDAVQRAMQFGIAGEQPWNRQGNIKWICPVPGYDRHFSVTELFGIEMINVPMLADGPDMDKVEELIKDPGVKGMWNVPKYSNPTGVIYSDVVVDRLAKMRPAAKDFMLMWDNAYMVHALYGQEEQANIMDLAKKYDLREGETEGFVNMALGIKDVRMSLLLKEEDDRFRVSVRSKRGISANRCAALYFNGGGHELAAGGKLLKEKDLDGGGPEKAASYTERVTGKFLNDIQ